MISDSGDALDFTDMTTTARNHRVDVLPTAVLLIVFALPVVAAAQDKVLGLLVLPEAFGYGPCQQFEPAAIELYDAPSAVAPIGTIQVDQHWSFAPHGGCDGLKVRVHSGGVRAELPTLEYSNESPAAIVLAAQDGWFKVRLAAGAAWLRASRHDRFISMADLFSEHPTLTALTEAHTGSLRETPGAAALAGRPLLAAGTPVRVLDSRIEGSQAWLQVAVMSHSVCDIERGGPPEVVGLGWLAAHASSGEPTVWFSSRGC